MRLIWVKGEMRQAKDSCGCAPLFEGWGGVVEWRQVQWRWRLSHQVQGRCPSIRQSRCPKKMCIQYDPSLSRPGITLRSHLSHCLAAGAYITCLEGDLLNADTSSSFGPGIEWEAILQVHYIAYRDKIIGQNGYPMVICGKCDLRFMLNIPRLYSLPSSCIPQFNIGEPLCLCHHLSRGRECRDYGVKLRIEI